MFAGCLLDSMIDDLVIKVISVEDIPAKVASELVNLYNIVVNRAPSIFPVNFFFFQLTFDGIKFLMQNFPFPGGRCHSAVREKVGQVYVFDKDFGCFVEGN